MKTLKRFEAPSTRKQPGANAIGTECARDFSDTSLRYRPLLDHRDVGSLANHATLWHEMPDNPGLGSVDLSRDFIELHFGDELILANCLAFFDKPGSENPFGIRIFP